MTVRTTTRRTPRTSSTPSSARSGLRGASTSAGAGPARGRGTRCRARPASPSVPAKVARPNAQALGGRGALGRALAAVSVTCASYEPPTRHRPAGGRKETRMSALRSHAGRALHGHHRGRALGFWADVIGPVPPDEGRQRRRPGRGRRDRDVPVPEAKTVKHRVHLDVYTAAIDDLVARGRPWLLAEESGFLGRDRRPRGRGVLRLPAGGRRAAAYRLHGCVSTRDAEPSPAGGATCFGVEPKTTRARTGGARGGPRRPFASVEFAPVPEPKTVKNRIHWDLRSTVEEMQAAGATLCAPWDDVLGRDGRPRGQRVLRLRPDCPSWPTSDPTVATPSRSPRTSSTSSR